MCDVVHGVIHQQNHAHKTVDGLIIGQRFDENVLKTGVQPHVAALTRER